VSAADPRAVAPMSGPDQPYGQQESARIEVGSMVAHPNCPGGAGRVLAILPYRGFQTAMFTHVLRIESHTGAGGWIAQPVKLDAQGCLEPSR
jgi:hypothetical protein